MPRYKLQGPDGRTVTIEAADRDTAIRGAQEWAAANPVAQRPVNQAEQAALDYTRRIAGVSQMAADRPPRARPAPPVRGQSRRPVAEVNGGLANINRGIPLFDEIAGATGAIGYGIEDALQGRPFDPGSALDRGMALQRGMEDDFRTRRPLAATGLQSTGSAASALVPVGQAANGVVQGGRLMGAARGGITAAAQGAIYGLTDRGSIDERIQAGQEGAGAGAVLGSVLGGALTRPRPGVPRVRPPSDRNTLREAGVALTPGQAVPFFKLIEDIAARGPIVGGAIRGARARGGESFNRAVANRALAPLRETVPPTVNTGPEAIAYVERRLGQAFEDAYALAPSVRPDDVFESAFSAASAQTRVLPSERSAALNRRLTASLEPLRRGDLTGAEAGRIRSRLAKEATDFIKQGGEEADVGRVIRSVGDALDDLIARSDPTGRAGPALEVAREGWGSYAVLRRAGSNANTGIFTPGQLATAVRTESPSRAAVARGEANMQDLSLAAARVMPDSFGNPGTGDVTSTLALLGLAGTNPAAGATVATGLTAAAIPYWSMARNIAAKVPPNASRAQVQAAAAELDAIAARSPEASAAILALKDRIVRSAGAVGATATSERPGPPRR